MTLNLKIILAFCAGYFLLILLIILWARYKKTGRITSGLDEFFLAGRNISSFVLMATMVGSVLSAFFAIGIPGFLYANGLGGGGFIILGDMVGIYFILTFYKKLRAYAVQTNSFSPIECLTKSYNSKALGVLCCILMLFFIAPFLSLQLVGIGKFIEGFTGGDIGYVNGVGVMMSVVALYLIFGGMRAVAYTDVIQALAIFIGVFGGMFFFLHANWGSIGGVFEQAMIQAPSHMSLPGPNGTYSGAFFFSVSVLTVGLFFMPQLLTRGLMARDDKQIDFMCIGFLVAVLVGYIPIFVFGIGGFLLYGSEGVESNQVMGFVFQDLASVSLIGAIFASIALIGLIGAAMSTADSILLSIGQIFTRDIVRPFIEISHGLQILLARTIMVVVLSGAFVIGLNPPQLIGELGVYAASATCILLPTYVGFLWHRRNAFGAMISICIGTASLIGLALTNTRIFGLHEGFISLVITTCIYVVMCYIFSSKNK